MKGAILLLLLAAGTFYYFYAKTDRLDPYLEKYAPALLEAKGGAATSSEEYVATAASPSASPASYLELKSKDGRSIKASIISRGPVGVRAQRHDGQVFEIPFETLDADTVAVLNAIQTFPHPR